MTTSTSNGNRAPDTGLVAVIGLGCVMPDAANPTEFWQNIRSGRSSIREVPKDRWDPDLYYSPDHLAPDKSYSKIGSFVTGFKIDPIRFRLPPNVLKSLDEVQLWALAAAQQALSDAGYEQRPFDRSRCAVILGNSMGGEQRMATTLRIAWPSVRKTLRETPAFHALPPPEQERVLVEMEARYKAQFPEITEDTMPGELSNVIAGRIANALNLTGKNFTTDAACASSLAAIDASVKALVSHECDLVITGGADRSQDIGSYVKFCKIGALSAHGSFPFDARADGFVMGEGCALFVLKRYEDAARDGDRIYAVIRGVGSSSDGKGKGITAPNIEGQVSCVSRAFADAQTPPRDVDLVECHGTSTKVGDVVEIQGLTRILGPDIAKKQSVPIGSVKSNLGHLKSAAGAAALLKVILALHHRTLPPSINFETPNPNLKLEETPFYVNATARPWPETSSARPRRAGISSFGFGGTNFHVILEEYVPGKNLSKASATTVAVVHAPAAPPSPAPGSVANLLLKSTPRHRSVEPLAKAATTEVLLLGAPTWAELGAEVRRVQQELTARVTPRTLPSWLHEHNSTSRVQKVRVALVIESPTDAIEKLTPTLAALADPSKRSLLANKGIHFGEGSAPGKIAFLFPGQGSQYVDMMRELATRYEPVKRTIEEADRIMEPLVGKPLTGLMFLDATRGHERERAEEALKRTEVCQPAVLAADLALYRLLGEYGVKPDLVAGHSLGEYGALVAAGVLTFEDALQAVSARGREMANVHVPDLGKMASVAADPATVEARLQAIQGYVIPANKNCKAQTVIAGASASVEAAVKMFNEQGIAAQLIPVSAAFHSGIVAAAREPLKRVLERLDVREPKIPILSNVYAEYYPRGPDAREKAIQWLGDQVAAPVEWQRQIERMYDDGARLFVEVGPKATLTTFVKNILEGRPHWAVATNHPKRGGFYHFHDAIALLAAHGCPVRFPQPGDANIHLPAYRDTVETTPTPAPAAPGTASASAMPVTTAAFPQLASAFDEFVRQKQDELRELLVAQLPTLQPVAAQAPPVGNGELLALKRRVEELGLNLDRILITGVSVGTPGTSKKLFDDRNFERIFEGENSIEPVPGALLEKQVDKNIVRLVKSDTGDHRMEVIRDVAEVIKLAGQKGEFNFQEEYGVNPDFADSLDLTSKMAIAAGIEALRDAQIPLVRGYVRTSTGKFLPGEWSLPEPLQSETGIIFGSVWPGVGKVVEYVSQFLAHKYAKSTAEDLRRLYAELIAAIRNPDARREVQAWYDAHQSELAGAGDESVFKFNRRFLFHVLGMGHSQLAQLLRAKGPNTLINAACATTTQGVAIAEDWIRTGRCKRVLVVGADDVTNPAMFEYWASGFLAAGAATTKGDVREAALPFDRRRHGMIIGMGAVGLVVEAEQEVKARGMEGIVELLASLTLNSAYHGSRLDTTHIATAMDDLVRTVERRTGTPRSTLAKSLLFMSHETYTPARGGSAAAEIEALTKTFGPDVSHVVVSNTKGFTGHPMGASIEDAICIRSLQHGRVPPIANLKEPDPSLGNIQLSRGGPHDLAYGLRLAAGFGSQIAMFVVRLRSRDAKRILDPTKYSAWVSRISGTKNAELEIVHRTLRVKAHTPTLTVPEATKTTPAVAPMPNIPRAPAAAPRPAIPPPAPVVAPSAATVMEIQTRVIQLIAEKTGYPRDMLDPILDLEADLGIDTVKQAELFGVLRESYGIARDDTIQLKNYPTITKISEYLHGRLAGGAPLAPTATVPSSPEPPRGPAVPRPDSVDAEEKVRRRLLALVCEKTGYPNEMLDLDLDLEADLGIDTVKQAEIFGLIRSEFQLERDENLQLKDYNTLRRIVSHIAGRLPGQVPSPALKTPAATPAPNPTVVSPPPPAPPVAPPATGDRGSILEHIRSLVAQKTGYPPDLLEENLDLEADLGIDTVKQAEIFGLMRDAFRIPRTENLQLKDYNTLGKFADFVLQNAGGSSPVPVTAVAPEATAAPSEVAERTTHRYVVRYVPATPVSANGTLHEKTLLVWAPPNHRVALLEALRRVGAAPIALEALPRTYDEAKGLAEEQRRTTPRINGLLFVPTSAPTGSEFEPEDLAMVKSFFYLVKGLLSTGKAGELDLVATATFLGGDFATSLVHPINALEGGLVGIAKAISKELPSALVKCVDFDAKTPPQDLATTLVAELAIPDGLVEIGTAFGRGTLKLLEEETAEEQPGIELARDDVIVVSGGGAGITADVLAGLVKRAPSSFLLLGRTHPVPDAASLSRKTPEQWNQLRQEIAQRLKGRGERATPVAVEREVQKIQKAVEIHHTLQTLRDAGARAEYRACDVNDAHAIESALAEARRDMGPITGILHAAGVEESKLIVDKTPESFDRVFDVKLLGARNLLRSTAGDPLKFFASFGSVAGRFGNAGQADYSAANDALAKLSHALRIERGDRFTAFTIDWTAWSEKGMATRGSAMTVLREAGVTPIPSNEGVQRFLDELLHAGRDPEVLIAGELGRLATPHTFTTRDDGTRTVPARRMLRPAPQPPAVAPKTGQTMLVLESPTTPSGALLTQITSEDPRTVTATLLLDPEKDPYLRDHAVDHVPYLPGVFGLEAFAEAAQRLAPGYHYVGARDVEYTLPVKVLRNRPVEATVVASVASDTGPQVEVACRLESAFVTPKGERLGEPRIHFRAILTFTKHPPSPADAWAGPPTQDAIDYNRIYRDYFHGPSFRVLNELRLSPDGTTIIGTWARPTAPLFGAPPAPFLTQPLLVELAFQTAGGHELYRGGHLALPKGIRRIVQFAVGDEKEPIVAIAKVKGTHESTTRFDVVVQTESGRVLLRLDDFELLRIRPLAEASPSIPVPPDPVPNMAQDQTVYRSRWGHDFPLPKRGLVGCLVRRDEISAMNLKPAECLTAGERADQERYSHPGRSEEFFAGRLAAKEAIATLLERPILEARGIEVRRLETGEPVPRGQGLEAVLVTITHTGPYALAVAANRGEVQTIGIDAERIEEKPPSFETQSFTLQEIGLVDELLIQGRPRAESQILFWAAKEAVLKALGKGFALDLHDVRIQALGPGDEVRVELAAPALESLAQAGARHVQVQAWVRDDHAYALAWTRR